MVLVVVWPSGTHNDPRAIMAALRQCLLLPFMAIHAYAL